MTQNLQSQKWRKKEKQRISSAKYSSFNSFDAFAIKHAAWLIHKNRADKKLLELGCADGIMTQYLIKDFDVTAVDGWQKGVNKIRKRFGKKVKTHTCLFEEFKTKKIYSDIVISHVLEHIENPPELLTKAKKWLAPNGKIHIVVPHGHSLHRLLATAIGYLKKPNQLTKKDLETGHRRVYLLFELQSDVKKAGLKIIHTEGILIKPLPDFWMLYFGKVIINFFVRLGKYFPKIAGEIYLVCTHE